ncbi:MAG: ABC transporter permease [Chloroflexi bacterium]|nr:MAG: ABC transporter permease [Chloroflexota bacterium]MBL1196708.1 ABC transporter permease [Chloroflexota bacterium]NOH14001.1 ABC transporter permease [Chloroflexota bacterium]
MNTGQTESRNRALWRALGPPVIGAVIGFVIGALLILMAGANVQEAYTAMLRGAFGGSRQITETVLKAAPLLLVGLGLTVAFRARVWNIGGEGQFFVGALIGAVIALNFPDWPRPLLLSIMLLGGVVGGMLWAMLAGVMKIKWGVSEIISTLMFNYIAILLVQYMARGPLQEPGGYLPQSAQFVPEARLPLLFDSRIHAGVILAVILVAVVYGLLWATPLGFRLRMVGSRSSVARYAGVSVEKSILFVMAFSGGLIGLAGIIEVSTQLTRLKGDISGGFGFAGILVALLGRMHPLGVAIASILFAALIIGSESMHVVSGLPNSLADAIQAVIVLSVLAVDALARRRQK